MEDCGSISKVNGGGYAGFVPDDTGGVPFPRQVLCQVHMPWAVTVHAAIGEADLYFALQGNDQLPARGGVPIAKMAGLCGPKDDALGGHERGKLWMGGEV
jgi:hypothetical protein